MIEWWGPLIWEYYGGTEGNGLTLVNSAQWQDHKGTVGRAVLGRVKICAPDGEELSVGEPGTIYLFFSRAANFPGGGGVQQRPNRWPGHAGTGAGERVLPGVERAPGAQHATPSDSSAATRRS